MPAYLTAFVVVLFASLAVFLFSKKYACTLSPCSDYKRRRNAWIAVTSAAFLSHNIWLYFLLASIIAILASHRDTRVPSLFLFLIPAFPAVEVLIPGFGVINYLFLLTHPRLLSLVILLPAFLNLLTVPGEERGKPAVTDKLVIAFVLLSTLLEMRHVDATVTHTMRTAFILFLDVFLPYFIMSRGLKSLADFRDMFLYFAISVTIISLVAVFEHVLNWLLYGESLYELGAIWSLMEYMERTGGVRAVATAGHAIVLGYVVVIGIAFAIFLHRNTCKSKYLTSIAILVLCGGLYASLSRGPWVGAAALFVVFILLGPHPLKGLLNLGLTGIFGIVLLSFVAPRTLDVLPWIGSSATDSVGYRERLVDAASTVILRNPLFGSTDFASQPELLAMADNHGFIDFVNTYIQVSLTMGLVGLALFVVLFLDVLRKVYSAARSIKIYGAARSTTDGQQDLHLVGRILFAVIVAVLVTIGTVSSISLVPVLYWSLAGMGVAYWRVVTDMHGGLINADPNGKAAS